MVQVVKGVLFSALLMIAVIKSGYSQVYHFSMALLFGFTVWFWILVFAGVIFLTAVIVWMYYKKLERERLKNLVDERTEQLMVAIKDKEILVKEIHHRVKNNLAMIIGLLELQASNSIDESTTNTLRDSILRIYSMSLVHEKLYSNNQLTAVDVKYYITDLVQMISHSMNLNQKNIRIESSIDHFNLSLDHGITCGLLMNELVTNAIKHAFNGNEDGVIEVSFLDNGNVKTMQVRDNGNGLPDEYRNFEKLHQNEQVSLGLTLVQTLTKQLEGALEIESGNRGTQFTITF